MRLLKNFRQFSSDSGDFKFPILDNYQITGYLGKGSTSNVFQGIQLNTNKQVIVKMFKDTVAEEKIKREIRINQLIFQCKNIVPLRDVIRDEAGNYGLIFHNYKGVTLNHLIGKIDQSDSILYLYQIMNALKDIHSLNVVHSDIKPSNILITKEGAKLFDFGLSKQEGVDSFKIRRFGTKCYYTPEVVFRIPKYNRKVDIWTMGLIFAEMISKRKPLMPFKSDEYTQKQIVKFCGYHPDIVQDKSLSKVSKIIWYQYILSRNEKIISLISRMMALNPAERPEAVQVLGSDLFQQYLN